MKTIKHKIAFNLLTALYEANNAGCRDVFTNEQCNDLEPINSSQNDLFGHLALALSCLGYTQAYDDYVNNGDRVTYAEFIKLYVKKAK